MNIEENKQKIIKLLESTQRKGMSDLISWLKTSDFFNAPASSKFHLNQEGGLAQHSLNVYKSLVHLNKEYNRFTSEEVIIIALLHDLCKTNIYQENRLLNGNLAKIPYKREDELPIGHGEKSVILIVKHIELSNKEMIAIRWHMNNYDYSIKEYASTITDKYPEAFLLYFADHIASLYIDTE